MTKLISLENLKILVESGKKLGKTYAFTNGIYDLLGSHHLDLLQFAKNTANYLIVAVNSDESTQALKGKLRPLRNLKERIDVLSHISYVDYIITFHDQTPYNLIKEISPDFLVKGGDYNLNNIIGKDLVNNVKIFPLKQGYSTTELVKKIQKINDCGCSDNINPSDARQKEWSSQRENRGFDDTETWNLDMTFVKFMIPRLKRYKETHGGHPADVTEKKWNKILDTIIEGFEHYLSNRYDDLDIEITDKAFKLFSKWIYGMWW